MRYATKDDLVDLFGEAKSKYGTLDPNGGLKRTGNALSVDYSEVASVDALTEATALSPTGGIVSTQDGLAIDPEQSSTGAIDGALLELTAKGHAEQDGTPSPDSPVEIQVAQGRNLLERLTYQRKYNDSSGVEEINLDFARSDKMPCRPSTVYRASTSYAYTKQCFLYEWASDGTYIGVQKDTTARKAYAFTTSANTAFVAVVFREATTVTDGLFTEPMLTLGSTRLPYVPYGHVGMEVQGKNLLNYAAWRDTSVARGTAVWENDGVTLTATENDCYTEFGSGKFRENARVAVSEGQSLTLSWVADINASGGIYIFPNGSTTGFVSANNSTAKSLTYTAGAGVTFVSFRFGVSTAGTTIRYSNIQIEHGDHATSYELYYHSTTPIPLPSRGWVAGLPDGTADELSVDGAGKVVWELWARMLEIDGSETYAYVDKGSNLQARLTLSGIDAVKPESGIPRARVICDKMSSEVMSNFDSIINNAFVSYANNVSLAVFNIPTNTTFADYVGETSLLYPLATPVTENCGYIDLPDMQDCVLSIPELDALGVRYTIGDGAEIARQWYQRAYSEYEDRIVALEQAVAELVAG